MIVKKHIPNFVDVEPPAEVDVATFGDLMAVPFVRNWNDLSLDHFEISISEPRQILLMAILKNQEFWVVAYLYPNGDEHILDTLPRWTAPKRDIKPELPPEFVENERALADHLNSGAFRQHSTPEEIAAHDASNCPCKQFDQRRSDLEFHNDEYEGTVPDTVLEMHASFAIPQPTPRLNPTPGRIVVELVDRMTEFPGGLAMDPRYQYQPYTGRIVAFGEPLDEEDAILLKHLKASTDAGDMFIATWGSGTDFSTKQMMEFAGKNGEPRFAWLAKLRVFRIKDLAASISGGDELGGSDV